MSFFGKLFGGEKKPPFEMQPTAVMMDEDRSLMTRNGQRDSVFLAYYRLKQKRRFEAVLAVV